MKKLQAKSGALKSSRSLDTIGNDTAVFQKTVLPDGVRVLTEKIPHVRSASIGMWVLAGTRDETPEMNGIAHFVEHMLFKGTKKRSAVEIAQSIEDVGGHLNAFTSKELTCYYAHVLDADLPLAIDVLTDILIDSVFDPGEIRKEIDVILEEIKSVDDIPEERVHDYFASDLFGKHPLGYLTLGTPETVRNFDRDTILRFLERVHARNRLLVTASGNIDHKQVCELVMGAFETWPEYRERSITPPEVLPPHVNVRREKVSQAHICMGCQTFPFNDRRKFAALVLNTLLGGGMGSRLFQSVRESHGLCYNIYSFLDFMHDTGIFCIYAATDNEKVERAIELIKTELAAIIDAGITEEELLRTKSQLIGSLMLSLESTVNRMNRIAKFEIYQGNHFNLDEAARNIEEVEMTHVQEVASEILDFHKLTTTIIKA